MANANIKIKTDQYYLLTMRRAKTAELGFGLQDEFLIHTAQTEEQPNSKFYQQFNMI